MSVTIKRTIPAFDVDMGGLAVKQALPTNEVNQIDPFLLLHHTQVPVSKGTGPLQAGVPPHPHRGFSAVTFVIGGEVHHRDSLGNSSVIGPGGVQWVNAGRGIIHSERPSAEQARKGGAMDVIQLWINTPAAHKMEPAAYYAYDKATLPKVNLSATAEMHLVTGLYAGLKGKIPTSSPMLTGRVYATGEDAFSLRIDPGFNTIFYVISGKGKLQGYGLLEAGHLYHVNENISETHFETSTGLDMLVLSGQALAEALATYGPFVMNTQTQIMEALRDYQNGRMGVLIEE